MAAEGGQQGQKRNALLSKLANIAASDAAHDFDGERGTFIFKELFKSYKGIGTPIEATEQLSEYAIFCEALNLKKANMTPEESFNTLINVVNEGTSEQIIFPIYSGETLPYIIKTSHVATSEGEQRSWHLTPEALYDFLNEQNPGNELVFTIDFVNVPFYEHLLTKGETKKTAIYLITREGIVDGALKTDRAMDVKGTTVVKIDKVYDDADYNIAYHRTYIENLEKLHERELFFSKYSFYLPPIKNINGCLSGSIECTDTMMASSMVRFKSSSENKNPYTVDNLSNIINSIIGKYSAVFAKSSVKEREYHMALQLKRAGDWLQTLSCLDAQRFGLPAGSRIRLATGDRICLLYALLMGVDVIYTNYKKKDKKYYITTFYKQGGEVSELDITKSIVNPLIRSFKNPTDDLLTEKPPEKAVLETNTYLKVLPAYIRIRKEVHEILLGKIKEVGDNIQKRVDDEERPNNEKSQKCLTELLRAYVVLTHFRTFCPDLENDTADCQTLYATLQSVVSGAVPLTDDIKSKTDKYLKQFLELQDIIQADKTQSAGLNDYIKNIDHFLRNRFTKKHFPKVIEEKFKIIDTLEIIRKWSFSSEKLNENGLAIFSYISTVMDYDESITLFEYILTLRSLVKDTSRYDILMKCARLLHDIPPPKKGKGLGPLNLSDVTTSEVLNAMFFNTVQAVQEQSVGGGGGGGSSSSASEIIPEDLARAEAANAEAVKEGESEPPEAIFVKVNDHEASKFTELEIEPEIQQEQEKTEEEQAVIAASADPEVKSASEGDKDMIVLSEVAKKMKKPSIIYMSDYFAEQVILSLRAKGYFGKKAIKEILKATVIFTVLKDAIQSGGTHGDTGGTGETLDEYEPYSHNPLTTFCLIIIELNNSLSARESDDYRARKISAVLEAAVQLSIKQIGKPVKDIYKYLYSMEAFLLEGLAEILPEFGINHFMTGVKESFYGFSYIKDYDKLITLPVKNQKELAAAIPGKWTKDELIHRNCKLFVYILQYIGILETKLNEDVEKATLVTSLRSMLYKTRRKSNNSLKKRTTKSKQSVLMKAKDRKNLRQF